MDRHARTPDPLSDEGDRTENWRNWREDFLIFMTVTEYNKKSNEMKANLLKNLIGKVGLGAINSFTYDRPADKDDFGILLSKLDYYFDPPKTETELRYKFYTTKRQDKESIEEYVSNLREKAKVCNFGSLTESLIRDKAVLDTKDRLLRQKFMTTQNLTVEKLISLYSEHEAIVQKMRQLSNEGGKSNDNVNAGKFERRKDGCWRCGRRHPPRNCPAWGVKCEQCGEKNHFSHCCEKKQGHQPIKGTNKNMFDDVVYNNIMKKNNETGNSCQSTPSTSGRVTHNQTNDKTVPNNVTKQWAPLVPTVVAPAVHSPSDRNGNRDSASATLAAQRKVEKEFVFVPPPGYDSFSSQRGQTYKGTNNNKQKKRPKDNECLIS